MNVKELRASDIEYILVDLDNTVYPASTGLQEEINRKIAQYIRDLLDMPL